MARSSSQTFTPDVRRRVAAPLGLGAVSLAGIALLAVVDPSQGHFPLCPTKYLTGLDCPLCGGLRSVHSVLHGQFTSALHHNALVVIGAPFAIWWWAAWLRREWTGQPGPRTTNPARRRAILVSVVTIAVLFVVVRNLPFGAALASGSVR